MTKKEEYGETYEVERHKLLIPAERLKEDRTVTCPCGTKVKVKPQFDEGFPMVWAGICPKCKGLNTIGFPPMLPLFEKKFKKGEIEL